MVSIRILNLSNNRITSIGPLGFLGEIESLEIAGNLLPCAELRKLVRVLGAEVVENTCKSQVDNS
jgi:hypothetical protein